MRSTSRFSDAGTAHAVPSSSLPRRPLAALALSVTLSALLAACSSPTVTPTSAGPTTESPSASTSSTPAAPGTSTGVTPTPGTSSTGTSSTGGLIPGGNTGQVQTLPPVGTTVLSFGASGASVLTQPGGAFTLRAVSAGAQDGGAAGRDVWATFEVSNAGTSAVRDVTLYGLNRAMGGLAGTAFEALEGDADVDPLLGRAAMPGALPLSANRSFEPDAQAFSDAETDALQQTARRAALIEDQDSVLGYGFVAQQENSRVIPAGGRARVTIAYHVLAPQRGAAAQRFTLAFLLAGDQVTRVTRGNGETLTQVTARAAQVGATQIVLPGNDSSSLSAGAQTLRVPSPRHYQLTSGRQYGVIQPDAERLGSDRRAGMRVRTLELAWDRVEPSDNAWDSAYLSAKRAEYWADIRAGFDVVLELGVQYPPQWLVAQPDSHFVDQHGTAYTSDEPGANPVNAVFSQAVRDQQAQYVRQVFSALGNDFFAVRLGWGRYGELGYPLVAPGANSYWAYDDFAQGRRSGLPAGMTPSPLPGWQPLAAGQAASDADRSKARTFLNWYLGSLQNYHDWQISLLRGVYQGRLFMLYPSFGVRPGQLDAAIAGGLNGQTSPEVNTEIQRGFDFARFVTGIRDPQVSPYTTWLDADGFFVNDASSDQTAWNPAHYLSTLASSNPLHLTVWGENTGRNSQDDLTKCGQRVRAYNMGGMFWAFNADLYDHQHASIGQYASMIAATRER